MEAIDDGITEVLNGDSAASESLPSSGNNGGSEPTGNDGSTQNASSSGSQDSPSSGAGQPGDNEGQDPSTTNEHQQQDQSSDDQGDQAQQQDPEQDPSTSNDDTQPAQLSHTAQAPDGEDDADQSTSRTTNPAVDDTPQSAQRSANPQISRTGRTAATDPIQGAGATSRGYVTGIQPVSLGLDDYGDANAGQQQIPTSDATRWNNKGTSGGTQDAEDPSQQASTSRQSYGYTPGPQLTADERQNYEQNSANVQSLRNEYTRLTGQEHPQLVALSNQIEGVLRSNQMPSQAALQEMSRMVGEGSRAIQRQQQASTGDNLDQLSAQADDLSRRYTAVTSARREPRSLTQLRSGIQQIRSSGMPPTDEDMSQVRQLRSRSVAAVNSQELQASLSSLGNARDTYQPSDVSRPLTRQDQNALSRLSRNVQDARSNYRNQNSRSDLPVLREYSDRLGDISRGGRTPPPQTASYMRRLYGSGMSRVYGRPVGDPDEPWPQLTDDEQENIDNNVEDLSNLNEQHRQLNGGSRNQYLDVATRSLQDMAISRMRPTQAEHSRISQFWDGGLNDVNRSIDHDVYVRNAVPPYEENADNDQTHQAGLSAGLSLPDAPVDPSSAPRYQEVQATDHDDDYDDGDGGENLDDFLSRNQEPGPPRYALPGEGVYGRPPAGNNAGLAPNDGQAGRSASIASRLLTRISRSLGFSRPGDT
jgi:hypothetical protein